MAEPVPLPKPLPSSRSLRLALALLALASLTAYWNSLSVPFVFDDVPSIPDNPAIRHLWPLTEVLFSQPNGGLTVSGRPGLSLSFALNYAVSGPAVWSYHALNLLIHTGAGLLLLGLVRRTLSRPPLHARFGDAALPLALAIAALWTLHPLHTESVTYTVQRAESLMGFCYLLTLYAFVRAVQSPAPRWWFGLAVTACLLGLATKEVTATAPLLVWLYDRTFVAGSFRAAWRQRRGFHLALAATWLPLGCLVWSTGGNRSGTVGFDVGVAWWAYGLTQIQAVARYLGLSVWPHPLVFEYGTFWVQRAGEVLPSAAVVLPLLAVAVVALWRRPVVGFAGAWFFAILAPTSLTPGTIQMIVEHRMYLSLAAVLSVLVLAAHVGLGRRALLAWAAVAVVFAGLTLRRNHDYRSALALWTDTVAKAPGNAIAHDNLGEALAQAGRLDEAIRQRQEAVRLQPDEPRLHYNLALNLVQAGRTDEAISHDQRAIRLEPDNADAHDSLAVILVETGRFAAALPHYEAAVRLQPANPQFHYNRAIAFFRLARLPEAIAGYQAALRLRPDFADAHFNLAAALALSGRLAEAISHYEAALRLQPGSPEKRTTFGGALLAASRPAEAAAQFQTVLETRPDDPEARFGLGNALAASGRPREAVAHYEAVLRRAPNHASAHFKLGNVLLDTDRVAEAVAHYEAAVRLRPDDAESHHNLGVTYARLDRFAEARAEFEAALRLRPDYADARRHLDQVRALLPR